MREDNEDSLFAVVSQDSSTQAGYSGTPITGAGLLILADGMGGRAHGKVASETATVTIYRELAHVLALRRRVDTDYLCGSVTKAIAKANAKINDLADVKPDAGGMGTTVAVALIVRDQIVVGHVGDSRAYLLSGDDSTLHLLTEDHSLVQDEVRAGRLTAEQARRSKNRNVITRAVGVDSTVDADVSTTQISPGMVAHLIVSSDGMHGSVTEAEIVQVLRENASSPQDAAEALVNAARNNGARDNITVVVAMIDTRFDTDSYGIIGLDGVQHPLDSEFGAKPYSRKLPWLTSANLLAFAIGMVIMGAIAWRFFPSAIPTKSTPNILMPITISAPHSVAPGTPLMSVNYAPPTTVIKGPLNPNYLNWEAGNVFTVDDRAKHDLVSVDVSTDKVILSKPDSGIAVLSSTPTKSFTTSDNNGNHYASLSSPPALVITSTSGSVVRIIGVGQLISPAAIQIAPSGDIVVIDGGVLKRFVAVSR
jgi:protein phosphatase